MRPDGTLERPDQLASTLETDIGPANRLLAGADAATLYRYVQEALRYYQGWYIPHPLDPWTGVFPYARYLQEGAELQNIENGDYYKITEVQRAGSKPTGYVVMTGNIAPKRTDRLVFVRDENELQFMHAYPKTFAQTYTIDENALPLREGDPFLENELTSPEAFPWRDTVTFLISRQVPGSLDGTPFQGTRDYKPKFRKNYDHPGDSRYSIRSMGQWFDCLLQLDCWAKTNSAAEDLADWIHSFMFNYAPVFIANGFPQVFFWAREMDGLSTKWRNDILYRTLVYYIRMEDVGYVDERRIRRIFLEIGTTPTGTGILDPDRFGTGWRPQATGLHGAMPVDIFESN